MTIPKKLIEDVEANNLKEAKVYFEKRGGARPNSGRPKGSGKGRTATARLQFCVTEEFKEDFERMAEEMGYSSVEFLRYLFRAFKNKKVKAS